MRTLNRLIAVMMVLLLLAACGKPAAPVSTAPPGSTGPASTVPIAVGPRIVSTVPAATLNLVLLGAADSLVGISTFDSVYLPDDKKDLPIVGDYMTMNYERLIPLKPTAIILQMAESHIPARLRELAASQHFEIVNIKLDTTSDLWDTVRTLGRISGKKDAAEVAILKAQGQLKELADSLAGKARPKVVYLIEKNPMKAVGSHNFMDEVLTLAGAENVGAAIGNTFPIDPFPTISNETLINLAPDVLLIGAPSEPPQAADDSRLEAWRRFPIPAAKNGRIFLVTDGDALDASIDLAGNVRALSALIHKDPAGHDGGGIKP